MKEQSIKVNVRYLQCYGVNIVKNSVKTRRKAANICMFFLIFTYTTMLEQEFNLL